MVKGSTKKKHNIPTGRNYKICNLGVIWEYECHGGKARWFQTKKWIVKTCFPRVGWKLRVNALFQRERKVVMRVKGYSETFLYKQV